MAVFNYEGKANEDGTHVVPLNAKVLVKELKDGDKYYDEKNIYKHTIYPSMVEKISGKEKTVDKCLKSGEILYYLVDGIACVASMFEKVSTSHKIQYLQKFVGKLGSVWKKRIEEIETTEQFEKRMTELKEREDVIEIKEVF